MGVKVMCHSDAPDDMMAIRPFARAATTTARVSRGALARAVRSRLGRHLSFTAVCVCERVLPCVPPPSPPIAAVNCRCCCPATSSSGRGRRREPRGFRDSGLQRDALRASAAAGAAAADARGSFTKASQLRALRAADVVLSDVAPNFSSTKRWPRGSVFDR